MDNAKPVRKFNPRKQPILDDTPRRLLTNSNLKETMEFFAYGNPPVEEQVIEVLAHFFGIKYQETRKFLAFLEQAGFEVIKKNV